MKGEVSGDLVRGFVKAFPGMGDVEFQGVPRSVPEEDEDDDDDNYEGVPWLDYGSNHHDDGDGDGNNSGEDNNNNNNNNNNNSTTTTNIATIPQKAILKWPSVKSFTISPYKPNPYDLATIGKNWTLMVRGRSINPPSPFTETLDGLLDALVRFQGATHFDGSITLPSADMFRQLL